MLFATLDGKLMLTLHSPNETPLERPAFYEMEERDGKLAVKAVSPQTEDK